MNKYQVLALLALTGLAAGNAIAADAWRWREGRVWVYGDKYPRGAESLEKVIGGAGPASPSVGIDGSGSAVRLFPVVVFGVGCPGCEAAKRLLDDRKVPYSIKDPSKADVYEEFKKLSPQSMAPVILVGDKSVIGFEAGALNGALDDAGYSRAGASSGNAAQGK